MIEPRTTDLSTAKAAAFARWERQSIDLGFMAAADAATLALVPAQAAWNDHDQCQDLSENTP